ncbi:WD40-repeat-containing domain protein [Chytriomyces sp. MP71]|nr:WD40-repeat-containing domain protein [Chytriomyces sp. MP71]
MQTRTPIARYPGHHSNIFCIAFTKGADIMYSCANDGLLLKHDVSRGISDYKHHRTLSSSSASEVSSLKSPAAKRQRRNNSEVFKGPDPLESIDGHDGGAVLKLSMHPETEDVVLTCGQDGSVALWDFRASQHAQGRIETVFSQNCVTFNPAMTNLFLNADDFGNIILRDIRTAFTSTSAVQGNGYPYLLKFHTTLSKPNRPYTSNPIDTTSVAFTPCGTLFAATFQKWRPTLYTLRDSFPLAMFKSRQDGIKFHGRGRDAIVRGAGGDVLDGCSSSCTIKTGAFGDALAAGYPMSRSGVDRSSGFVFGMGSDDRRAYVWDVPREAWLMDRRRSVDAFADATMEVGGGTGRDVAFVSKEGVKKIPFLVEEELFSMAGHRSVVNSVAFHPRMPLIATAGVEKVVRLFSPYAWSDYDEEKDNKTDSVHRNGIMAGFMFPHVGRMVPTTTEDKELSIGI